MFNTILAQGTTGEISIPHVLICIAASIFIGLFISIIYRFQSRYSKTFMLTLAILPIVVQSVILVVNGNLGTAVAVAGAFSLVRFRSLAGNAKEITFVFFAMAAGLACGMGYVTFALIFVFIVGILVLILSKTPLFDVSESEKELKITIPESLDYTGIFDDIFDKYLKYSRLDKVRTTNLGSMYELTYSIKFKNIKEEKSMIDEIRCRNGNLTIVCAKLQNANEL